MSLSRREFFQRSALLGAASALPSWTPRVAFRAAGQAPRGDVLVCVFLRGGLDGLSAVVPYEERGYFDNRPRIAFKAPGNGSGSVLPLDAQFALSPGLAGLKQIWDDGKLAVIHATGSGDTSRSHFDAMDVMERAAGGPGVASTGWLGRHLAATAQATDSPFRAIGWGSILQQSLRGPIPAASLQSIVDFHLQGRTEDLARFRQHLESLYWGDDWVEEDARGAFSALDLLEQADPLSYAPDNGATYPEAYFAQGLKQIAQLIKADVGLEVACIDIGGWDTHVNQVWTNNGDPTFGQMHNLLKKLDEALTAFTVDLGRRLEDPGVTVVTMSEFGRRVAQNSANGTDHGRGGVMFVISGAAVQGVHTEWPGLEPADLVEGDLAITRDYRDVLAEILYKRMGNTALPQVFPGFDPTFRGVVTERAGLPELRRDSVFLPALQA